MESGRFTRFSENAPFGKPGIMRGFRGLRPPFGIPTFLLGVAGTYARNTPASSRASSPRDSSSPGESLTKNHTEFHGRAHCLLRENSGCYACLTEYYQPCRIPSGSISIPILKKFPMNWIHFFGQQFRLIITITCCKYYCFKQFS